MATPPTRIGETERAAAQLALQEHLNAGRLQVNEYADRSARAANAVSATEVAALFADLPAPHPKLPGSPVGGTRRNLAIVGAVVALAVVTLLAFVIGRGGQNVAAPSPVVVAGPTMSAAPTIDSVNQTTSITPSESADGSAAALPDSTTVRRTTGAVAITLRPSYSVDLDDNISPNWNVGSGCCDPNDIGLSSDASQVYIDNDYAVETGSPGYATCAQETGYTHGAVERGSLKSGENFCVRTNENRYALVTIVSASDQAVQFRAVVWDPPFSS